MGAKRWNLVLSLGLILTVALACNFSASTANISSLKIGKDEKVSTEAATFNPTDTVYIVAVISNTSDKQKVRCRLILDDVKGQAPGTVFPGSEKDVELPGSGTALFNYKSTTGGLPAGRYKVEVSMLNESGEQKDQKTATFTVAGGEE